ncbi:MAG: hypothetical protein M1368_01080 [Thaumarchaeota archaeon]|nr:hypothetical protein [Nitrososphaerota archaeon]
MTLSICELMPELLERTQPIVEPHTEMLPALSLLRFQKIDALPIGFKKSGDAKLALSGYSCLSQILALAPSSYRSFFNAPCEEYADKLSTVSAEGGLEALLRLYSETGFGFAWVDGHGKYECGGLVSLRDVIHLYERGVIGTDLSIGEVATFPVVSLPRTERLRRVLREMTERRIRRVFISGTSSAVSDRTIINHLFSITRLSKAASDDRNDLLETELGNIQSTLAEPISSSSSLKEAARLISQSAEGCLLCAEGVVTPWDLIMKPWKQGKLKVSKSAGLASIHA